MIPWFHSAVILCLSFILCLCVCLVLAHYFMILNDVASFIWWCEPINYCSCLVIVCGGIDRARRDYCKVLVMNIVLESKWRQRLAVSQCFLFASDLLVCIWYLNTWTSLHIAWSQYCIPTRRNVITNSLPDSCADDSMVHGLSVCQGLHEDSSSSSAWFQLLDLC